MAAAVLLAAACGTSPTTSAPPSATASRSVTGVPTTAFADTIRFALPATAAFGPLTDVNPPGGGDDFTKAGLINSFLHVALYRYDAHLLPVPSLASACVSSTDGRTITCTLNQAEFQNGDPVTAADVVFTYRVMAAGNTADSDFTNPCVAFVNIDPDGCLYGILASVHAIDDRTVTFQLTRPYGPFFTLVLPAIWIDSEKVVRASYERFHATAATLSADDLQAQAHRLQEQIEAPNGNCEPLLQDAAQLLARAGLFLPDRAEFNYLPGGAFDACGFGGYGFSLSAELADAAASLRSADEVTAIAEVYPALDIARAPVGAGPYRIAGYEPNKQLTLDAWPGYHGGVPATPHIRFFFFPGEDEAAKAVGSGKADWVELYDPAPFHQLAGIPSLQVGRPANPSYLDLTYNVRPGRLFSDVRLRQAVELCLDKPAAVAASTDGRDLPAYADVPPGSWAYDAKIPTPLRDVAGAKALMESAGWNAGSDGIYEKAGQRLAATVYLNVDPERVKLAGIIRLQERACGIDLQPSSGDFFGNLSSIFTWPNNAPDRTSPFEVFLGGWSTNWDPLSSHFRSDSVDTKAQPDGINFGGFVDPRVDDLLRRVETTYDLDTRAELSRQYQEILAAEQPVLFLSHWRRLVVAAAGMRTTDGPLDFGLQTWLASPQSLVLEERPSP